ncbi:MAG: hypothetical protein AAGC63_05665 [Propionicimonas sp.]
MKPDAFMFVVLADQVSSRAGSDRVPTALDLLTSSVGDRAALPFERTAGDELQGLTPAPDAVVDAVAQLTRLGGWRIGIGAGEVETPLPESTRAARGGAYLAAREAIGAARSSPTGLGLAVAGGDPAVIVTAGGYGEDVVAIADAETALWLLRGVLERRSQEGWELVDLLDRGLTNTQAAGRLGISPSAVSQRLARTHRTEAARAAALAGGLLARLGPHQERP